MNINEVVYTPVDIELKVPESDELVSYVKSMTILNPDDDFVEGITLTVGHVAKLDDYRAFMSWKNKGVLVDKNNPELTNHLMDLFDKQFVKELDENKKYDFYWEPKFEKNFPEIITAIKQIPFKQLYAVFFGYAGYETSPTHQDNYGFMNKEYIHLERYNILLTCHGVPCFYFTKEKEGTKHVFPNIKKDNPVYAFDNVLCYHGSAVPNELTKDRIQMLVFGVIDKSKHQEFIKHSVDKFKDDIITISDLDNPNN